MAFKYLIACFLNYLVLVNGFIDQTIDQCPDDLSELNGSFEKMNSQCVEKHQFFCEEFLDSINCRILDRSFDCDTNQFCPNPIKNIEKVLSRSKINMEENNDKSIKLTAGSSNRTGNLNLNQTFIDLIRINEYQIVSFNSLKMNWLPVFQNLNSIRRLIINDNNIDRLKKQTFFNLNNLETLDLKFNNLKHLDEFVFDTLINLEELDLSNNLLVSILKRPFKNLPNLRQVTFLNNQLIFIDSNVFLNINHLKELDLSNNIFGKLNFENLEQLEFLRMNSNKIKNADCKEIYKLKKLKMFELDQNEIGSFQCDLKRFPNLYLVSLKGNRLTTLNESSFFKFIESSRNLGIRGIDFEKVYKKKHEFLKYSCEFNDLIANFKIRTLL